MNYHHPTDGVLNYGLHVDQDLLKTLKKDVEDWGKIHNLIAYDIC